MPDLEVFRQATRDKVPFTERVQLINRVYPSARPGGIDWEAIWTEDMHTLGQLLKDIIKADQAPRGKRGARRNVPVAKTLDLLRGYLGQHYTNDTFQVAFRRLAAGRTHRDVATITGLDRNRVDRLLHAKAKPTVQVMEQTAAGFELRPSYFTEWRIAFITNANSERLEADPDRSIYWFRRMRGLPVE